MAMKGVRPSLPCVTRRLTLKETWLENGRWVAMNPSVVLLPTGERLVSYRLVNYRNRRASYYRFMDPDGVIRTRVVLQRCAADGTALSEHLLEPPSAPVAGPYQGLEDIRLFLEGTTVCFSASYAQLRALPVPRLVYGRTDYDCSAPPSDGVAVAVTALVELTASPPTQTEKNWLPLPGRRWLYGLAPPTIVELSENGQCAVVTGAMPRFDVEPLRGSSGPVCVAGTWLSLYHYYSEGDGRWYHHRWVRHDPTTWEPLAVSETFCFNKDAAAAEVEFACGLAVLPSGTLLVTYGKDDCEAWEAEVAPTSVMDLVWFAP